MICTALSASPRTVPSAPPATLSAVASSRNCARTPRRRSLGDRDQHDVGDSEPADQQADAGDDAEQHRERLARLVLSGEQL
jgi:hypothetical protein